MKRRIVSYHMPLCHRQPGQCTQCQVQVHDAQHKSTCRVPQRVIDIYWVMGLAGLIMPWAQVRIQTLCHFPAPLNLLMR